MRFQPELKGCPNGTLSDEAIHKHAAYLSSETVNVTHDGFMSRAPILIEYWSDGDQFSFRFSPPALRFLEEANDPRLDLVADLFSGIDLRAAPPAVATISEARKARGLVHAMRLLAEVARTARVEDRAKLKKMAGDERELGDAAPRRAFFAQAGHSKGEPKCSQIVWHFAQH